MLTTRARLRAVRRGGRDPATATPTGEFLHRGGHPHDAEGPKSPGERRHTLLVKFVKDVPHYNYCRTVQIMQRPP